MQGVIPCRALSLMKQGKPQSIGLIAALAGFFSAGQSAKQLQKSQRTLPPSLCAPASSSMPYGWTRPKPGWRGVQSKRRHKEILRRQRANA